VTEYSPAKTGEYPSDIPHKTPWVAKNTIASIWREKYARIFVFGHYLFLTAHSFPQATLTENGSPSEPIMSVDKYPSIFPCQMEAIVYTSSH